MLLRNFNLREQPFGVTPDPRYLFPSETHREALASLLYGMEAGLGFVALIAKPGMGKTTLLFETLRRMEERATIVFLFQTIHTPTDLVRALLFELGVTDLTRSLIELQGQLNEILLNHSAGGNHFVVVIDEAQNLSEPVLEAVRMLSNVETTRHKLIQVILSGQSQLDQTLALPQMLQLRQRISIFARLQPLTAAETTAYIHHRLQVAGSEFGQSLFTDAALALIARHSEGIPRNINNICFNALSLGCALQRKVIDIDMVKEVISDLDISEPREPPQPRVRENSYAATVRQLANASGLKIAVWSLVTALCAILFFLAGRALLDKPVSAKVSLSPGSTMNLYAARPPDERTLPAQPPRARSVQVRKGETLSGICVKTFPGCRPQQLRELVRMNASIANPDRIRAGQIISLPNFPQRQ